MKKAKWTRKSPATPNASPSDWYWFWADGKTEPWVMEVWVERYLDHLEGFWWTDPISRPEEMPKIRIKKKGKKSGKHL